MSRSVLGVLAGFLVMIVLFFAVRFGAFAMLGESRMFEAGTHEPSGVFILVEIVGALAAALLGGVTCGWLSKATRPPVTLALAVFIMGIIFIFPAMTMAEKQPTPRTPGAPMVQSMSAARRPVWAAMVLPVAGVAGLIAGGAIGSRGTSITKSKK